MKDHQGVSAATWQRLLDASHDVRQKAWAPYSEFHVGAALLTHDDEIIVGCNVENATYGATVCAERTAIGTAVSQGVRSFKAICVLTQADAPVAPCGICRQVLAEFAEKLPVLMATTSGKFEYTDLDALLPYRFKKSDFKP